MINYPQKHAKNALKLTLKSFHTLYVGLQSENNNKLHLNKEPHKKSISVLKIGKLYMW